MAADIPGSVLFCCDYNSVRSPMAEALMKHHFGHKIFVQSAGVKNERDVDGFSIAVCAEIGIELSLHKVRSFDEMANFGNHISSFDLIVALSKASFACAQDYTRVNAVEVEFWPTPDPSATGRTREEKLNAYRACRDALKDRILERFSE